MRHERLLNVGRIENLTDGLFATAMTILVFSVQLPEHTELSSLSTILDKDVLQTIFIYCGGFIILGTKWVGLNFLHGFLERVNRTYMLINILYLIPIGVVPFSTSLLIDFPHSPISIRFYVINLVCSSVAEMLLWNYGARNKLYNSAYSDYVGRAVAGRLCLPPVLYLLSLIVAEWDTRIAFGILIFQPFIHMIPGKIDKYINEKESK